MPLFHIPHAAMLATAFAASAALAGGEPGPTIAAAQAQPYGTYVVDGQGRALYMFTADQRGQGAGEAVSNCYDACAKAWPPLTVRGKPQVGPQLQQGLVDTIQRRDGTRQVTYGGWPLYYYVRDQGPGAVTGQDVHGFGGEWYLVGPGGSKIEKTKGG